MTFKDLQDDLIEEVGVILKDMVTTKADGTQAAGFTGYAYDLPVTMAGEDEEALFPFYIVKVLSGETKEDADWWHVGVDIIIGIHDDAPSLGHEHVMIAIQRVANRFVYDPGLAKKYRAEQDVKWFISDESPYPWHFGSVAITFSVGKIGRKEYYV